MKATRATAELLSDRPVSALRGAGPKVVERLARLNIRSVQDLLLHLPSRYQDRTRLTPIGALRSGLEAVVEGTVEHCDVEMVPRRTLRATVRDDSGVLHLRFFHFGTALRARLRPGARVRCYGEPRNGFHGLEVIHPELTPIGGPEPVPMEQRLTPVYPVTEGLQQGTLRSLSEQAMDIYRSEGERVLPEGLSRAQLQRLRLPKLADALEGVHRPPATGWHDARVSTENSNVRRFVFEELLAHHLSLRRLRHRVQQRSATPLAGPPTLVDRFLGGLGFPLTGAQERVIREIQLDVSRAVPMMRLLQGDVGCGKTVVATAALLQAVANGRQAAFMAPTELLAEQHYRNLRAWLAPLEVSVVWLAGRLAAAERAQALNDVAEGCAGIVVGTHALFQEKVVFRDLALVVVDEQHRFGVHQRLALREKGRRSGRVPHQLIMTATPIPRTLAMAAYADLDVSVIDELPPGRSPVQTVVVPDRRRSEVIERVSQACRSGRQAYWVCTLIEESEALEAQAAEDAAQTLKEALPDLRIGLAHGRQKPAEREATMAEFKAGTLDVLVATTVIEVGVDVANASLMIIENAERLGLAQLHQLRGRVGRGTIESYCLLMYRGRLSDSARARLEVLRDSNDGFQIAQRDLQLRGPGEVLGIRQTGDLRFRVVDLARDQALLPEVRAVADELLEQHPESVETLLRRWIGDSDRYGEV